MGQNFERVRDVEARVGIGQGRGIPEEHGELSLPRLGQHTGGQIHARRIRRELAHPVEEQPGAATDLEHSGAGAVAGDQIDFEIVEHLVVAAAALALVPTGEVVVVGPIIEGRGHGGMEE